MLFPINRYAYKMVTGDARFDGVDSQEQISAAEKYLNGQLLKIDSKDADVEELRSLLLKMYANPVINYISATE